MGYQTHPQKRRRSSPGRDHFEDLESENALTVERAAHIPRVIPAATIWRPRGGPRERPNSHRVATLQTAKDPGKETGGVPNENERPHQR